MRRVLVERNRMPETEIEMTNYVSGPIVAALGTAEGVVVKTTELIGTVFRRGTTGDEGQDEGEAQDALSEGEPEPVDS
jgi:hypothetical protein